MPALTPSFVFDLESRMRMIRENEYLRLGSNLWWQKVTKVLPSQTRKQILTWILSAAQLEDQGQGGNFRFESMSIFETEFEPSTVGKALKLRRQQFEDLDGNGVQLAAEWAAQIGAQHAYWPQKLAANFIKTAHVAGPTTTAYDGLAFFANNHPVNPIKVSKGTFSNVFTGAAASTPSTDPNDAGYPGAVPIDESVTADVALQNLAKVFAYIASIKMPNGEDPRFLRPKAILCGPRLFPRVAQLTSAKFLAQAASSGGGSADVTALISALGYGMPIMADELSGFESDTTYFVICEEMASSEMGAIVYIEREPFSVRYFTGRGGGNGVDAVLDRGDELEWHTSGRNAMAPGHPFFIFKCKAT